jgi:serine/threonine-protein kinase
MRTLREQDVLAGKYRLIRELGRGGMGTVWSAEHLTLRSMVAIKVIDPAIAERPDATARFLREARAAAALRSPHVVHIMDHGMDDDVPFIAMELLDGESLTNRLKRVGRLSPKETALVSTHIARAVGRAHEAGIVHRDLKPDNVFLVRNDEEEIAKVLDFGIAKTTEGLHTTAGGNTDTGALLGTPNYMSPEQAEAKPLDHRTDIWSMGVIAFECLLGHRPFVSQTMAGLVLAICTRPLPVPSRSGPVPAGFDEWFARACAREPSQRFSSAKEAATELRQICEEGMPIQPSAIAANTSSASETVLSRDATSIDAPDGPAANSVIGFSKTPESAGRAGRAWSISFALLTLLAVAAFVAWKRLAPPSDLAGSATTASPLHAPNDPPSLASAVPPQAPAAEPSVLPFSQAPIVVHEGPAASALSKPTITRKGARPAASASNGSPATSAQPNIDLGI